MEDKLSFPHPHHSPDFPPEVVDLFCRIFGEHADDEDIIRNQEAIHESLRRKIFKDGFGESGSSSRLPEDHHLLHHLHTDLEDLFLIGPNTTPIRNADVNDEYGGDFSGELQNCEKWSGRLSKRLAEELVLKLPSHNYKSGSSSKWDHNSTQNYNQCNICKLNYQEDDSLTTLPCGHKYHQHCIYTRLKINNTCCICNEEVISVISS